MMSSDSDGFYFISKLRNYYSIILGKKCYLPSTIMFWVKGHIVVDGLLQLSSKLWGHHIRYNLSNIHEVRIAEVHLYRHVVFQGLDEALDSKRASKARRESILSKDVQNLFFTSAQGCYY
jgi:hypothetical protein